jgi:5-hydroxyisourate hydrolase-like protein (transthyretin family)
MRGLGLLLCAALALAAGTGTIEGKLLHGDGTPWAGAQVTAYKLGEKKPWKRSAETDKEGRFRLADLPPGRYLLRHGPKPKPKPKGDFGGLFEGMIEDALWPLLAEAGNNPNVITIAAGQTVRKDIRLPRRATVRFVVTHRGRPATGAKVEVFRVDKNNKPGWTMTVGEKRLPRTDRRGIGSLGKIDEGRYAVEFQVGQWSVYGGVHEVKGSEPHSFPVELGKYSVRVKILDGRGEPVPRAMVSVSWGEANWDFVRSRDMKEFRGENGIYRVPYVRAGKIRVWINAKGDATGGAEGIEVGPKNPDPEVVVRLEATATLVIRVVDAKGKPVPSVHVRIENADSEKGTPGFGYDVDRRGEFRQEVTLRRWRVRIEDFDHGDGEWTIVKPKANEEKVVVLAVPKGR